MTGDDGVRLGPIPAQSHHPLRGFMEDWRPREFGSTLEPDATEADPSAEFTSGRRDWQGITDYNFSFNPNQGLFTARR